MVPVMESAAAWREEVFLSDMFVGFGLKSFSEIGVDMLFVGEVVRGNLESWLLC